MFFSDIVIDIHLELIVALPIKKGGLVKITKPPFFMGKLSVNQF